MPRVARLEMNSRWFRFCFPSFSHRKPRKLTIFHDTFSKFISFTGRFLSIYKTHGAWNKEKFSRSSAFKFAETIKIRMVPQFWNGFKLPIKNPSLDWYFTVAYVKLAYIFAKLCHQKFSRVSEWKYYDNSQCNIKVQIIQ